MKSKTILAKIGIIDKIVTNWKKKGLKISYPMRKQKRFFKSDDGVIFVEGADKYILHLTRKEVNVYIRNPKKFEEDFFKNARLFRDFLNFIYKYQKRLKKLKSEERMPALLSLVYLFHRAMDHHYFHWDRYLVYEDYSQTPVGYWLEKLKDFYFKVKKEKVSKLHLPEEFLKLLLLDKRILNEFKEKLNKKDFNEFKRVLQSIKYFEKIQQNEISFFLDYERKQLLFFKVILPIWGEFEKQIEKHPAIIKKRKFFEIKKIINFHPLLATRKIFYPTASRYFGKRIISGFKKEIKRWL